MTLQNSVANPQSHPVERPRRRLRSGRLEPLQWARAWRDSDLNDDGILGDARTWLARRPLPAPGRLHYAS